MVAYPGALPQAECSFCGKGQLQVRWLFANNRGVFICEECVSAAQEMLAAHPRHAGDRNGAVAPTQCSFCGKGWDDHVRLIDTLLNPAYICNECIDRCQQLIDRKAQHALRLPGRAT
jgi:ATP-dependent protease Clp ATPase subunit